jgi:hypothetical protein
MDDTTLGLIELVKQRETIPDSGAAYSDDVLLNFLDQALKGFIVPAIEATLEEHFVVTQDTQMPTIPSYPYGTPPTDIKNWVMIPGESSGLRLRDVYIVGNDGTFYNLPRLTPTQAASQSQGNINWSVQANSQITSIGGFYLQGNQLQIFPYGLASGKLVRITYQRPPADLCLTTDAGMVVSITGDVCTLDKVLPWYAGITKVCAISGDLPHDYVQDASVATRVYTSYTPLSNVTLVNCVSNIITLPTGTGANIVAGDWICPRGSSVFAQNVPKDLLPVLVQKAASMVLESAGDRAGQKTAETTYVDMIKMALLMITPRVIGKPVKILPTNSAFKASRMRSVGRR